MKSIQDYINKVEASLNQDYFVFENFKYSPTICHWLDFSLSFVSLDDFSIVSLLSELNIRFGFDFVANIDRYDNFKGGMPGFTESYICLKSKSLVCYRGTNEFNENNVFLRFTGGAVQNLYLNNSFDIFLNFIHNLNDSNCSVRCVRIDIAKDCFTGFFDFCKNNDYSTRQRLITTLSTFGFENGKLDNHFRVKSGWTFYAGQRKNAIFVRVYDKAAERSLIDSVRSWVRVELEIKHSEKRTDWAHSVFTRLLNGEPIAKIYAQYLYKYFRVVDENDIEIGDPNRSQNAKVSQDFIDFINDEESFTKHKFCEELQHVDFITKQRNCQTLFNGISALSLCDMSLGDIFAHLLLVCDASRQKYLDSFKFYLTNYIDKNNILDSIPFLKVSIDDLLCDNDSCDDFYVVSDTL